MERAERDSSHPRRGRPEVAAFASQQRRSELASTSFLTVVTPSMAPTQEHHLIDAGQAPGKQPHRSPDRLLHRLERRRARSIRASLRRPSGGLRPGTRKPPEGVESGASAFASRRSIEDSQSRTPAVGCQGGSSSAEGRARFRTSWIGRRAGAGAAPGPADMSPRSEPHRFTPPPLHSPLGGLIRHRGVGELTVSFCPPDAHLRPFGGRRATS